MTGKRAYYCPGDPKSVTIRGITYIEHCKSLEEKQAAREENKRIPETRYAMPGRQGAYRKGQILDIVERDIAQTSML